MDRDHERRTWLTLTHYILFGLVLGAVVGLIAPGLGRTLSVLATLFVRLLQLLVVPLVFSSLVVAIGGWKADGSAFRRLALSTLFFFVAATTFAGLVGLAAANLIEPGLQGGVIERVEPPGANPQSPEPPPFLDTLIPRSIVEAMADNNVLGVVVFAVAFALALRSIEPAAGDSLLRGFSALTEVMLRLTGYVMWFAPLGVLGATASTVGGSGWEGLRPFLALLGTAYLALAFFVVAFFTGVSMLTRFSLLSLLRELTGVLVLAFSTASSSAVLPAAMARMETWGASPRTTSFVLPLGYSFNLTGTAVYLPLVTLFWAQLNGVTLSYENQFLMLAFVLIVIRGIPTVPRALFLVWGSVLARFDLPPEGVVVLLGIDPLIDMARTAVNVAGNCLAVAAVHQMGGSARPMRPAGP